MKASLWSSTSASNRWSPAIRGHIVPPRNADENSDIEFFRFMAGDRAYNRDRSFFIREERYGYENEIEEPSAVRCETQEEKRLRSAGLSRIGRGIENSFRV